MKYPPWLLPMRAMPMPGWMAARTIVLSVGFGMAWPLADDAGVGAFAVGRALIPHATLGGVPPPVQVARGSKRRGANLSPPSTRRLDIGRCRPPCGVVPTAA